MTLMLPLEPISSSKRIRILSPLEIENLYDIPMLTEEQRVALFELSPKEQALLTLSVSTETKIDAILRLGYFRKKWQFFSFNFHDVMGDVQHIIERYFPNEQLQKTRIGRDAKLKNQQWVLENTGYKLFSHTRDIASLQEKAQTVCRTSIHPEHIFRELLNEIDRHKITRPGYSTLQNMVSLALSTEQERISHIFKTQLNDVEKEQLLALLKSDENFYAVTLLKKQPKNFKPTAIRQEIEYFKKYQLLYAIAKRLLPALGLSKNNVEYYASLVEHYTVWSLSHIHQDQTCLWLLCFMYHRCQRMQDNLVTMFIYIANQYKKEVEGKTKELFLLHALSSSEKELATAKLIRVFTDKTVNDKQAFKKIKTWVFQTILPAERIDNIADELESRHQTLAQTEFMWQAVDQLAKTYLPLLRALVKVLDISGDQHKAVQKAYHFIKIRLDKGESLSKTPQDHFPIQFIASKISHFIVDLQSDVFHVPRYEYECYQKVAEYLNGKSLFVKESIQFRSFQDELLPAWQDNKKTIIKKINKPLLNESLNHFIEEKAKPLDKKILLLNDAILSGKNAYVKIKKLKNGETYWTLPYVKKSNELNNPFYEQLPPTSIVRVLQFANANIGLMKGFTHIKPHYSKSVLDEMAIYACLVANGTNLGLLKMSQLCDISFNALQTTDKNYLRLATLRATNDRISNAIAQLPIFRDWDLRPDILHSSLDGQRFITEWETMLARYSQKDFGASKSVVAYSMIANHVPINTTIISPNHYEGHYLFDSIYNNTSDIQPDVFSTDTAGSNALNFLLLHLIGKLFAPRFRTLNSKTDSIICFSNPSQFKKCIIKPQDELNTKLILSEENNIQHILASLLMGETQQSVLVTKLCSRQLSNRTKRALWEMNSVLMTDHIINYINDLFFRQSIQGALCRGEAYHQLRRYIERVNGRHFRGSTETQIAIWNECARLLANCVIYYNACILNRWKEKSIREGNVELAELIKRLSPVAWTHLNFQGRFQFLSSYEAMDIDALLQAINITTNDF